jgi:hypothetical protein
MMFVVFMWGAIFGVACSGFVAWLALRREVTQESK